MKLFEETFSDESLGQDAGELLYDIMQMNPYESLPEDKYGFKKGTFKVTVEWSPEE